MDAGKTKNESEAKEEEEGQEGETFANPHQSRGVKESHKVTVSPAEWWNLG